MPIYEYECKACGHVTEIIQHSQVRTRPRCTSCGGTMKRMISPSAFILKGSGWYVTDYPSKSRKEAMDAEKKAKGKKKGSSPKEGSSATLASGKATKTKAKGDT